MNKIIITMTFMGLLLSGSMAQNLERVTEKTRNPTKILSYHVLKGETIKHGPAEIEYKGTLGFREQGEFSNGQKAGVWEYINTQGDVIQKFNFSTYSFEFLTDFSSVKAVYILQDEDLVEVKTGAMPVLLGGDAKFYYYLANNLKYPSSARAKGITGTVGVVVTITKEGKMVNPFIPKEGDKALDNEALRVINMLPDEWVPLEINGEVMDSLVLLSLSFQ